MTGYGFTAHLAVDPDTGHPVAVAPFKVWPDGQVGVDGAALAVTDAAGVPILSLVSTALGVLPVFRAQIPVVVVTSGTYESVLVSAEHLVAQAQAAAQAAADAAAAAASATAQAEQLAAASGLPPGGSAGQALVRAAGGATSWGAPAVTAAGVDFAPAGTITATTVQGAVLQAAQTGSGGTGQILVVEHTTAGYTVPAARPAGVVVVWFRGPSQPLWDTLPGWLASVDCLYDWRA